MAVYHGKWLICGICEKPFFAHPKAKYCKRKKCREILRLRNLAYAKEYNKTHKAGKSRNKKWQPKIIYKTILCLKCHKPFKSEGIHNRLCDSCRRENGYLGNAEIYGMPKM